MTMTSTGVSVRELPIILKGVKTFPLNVEGCRDDSAKKKENKCSIYAARQGMRTCETIIKM